MAGSLGYDLLEWFGAFLKVPSGPQYGEPLWLTDEQAQIVLRWYAVDDQGRFVFRRGSVRRPKGWGKALALDTPVPTPSGWCDMGSLAVGDVVFGEDGRPCRVVAKSEVWHGTDCFRVTFSDGESVVASGDHLWTVEELSKEYRQVTVDTYTLRERLSTRSDGAKNFRVQNPSALLLPDVETPLDPYTLGVWLGDGERRSARFTSVDEEVVAQVRSYGHTVKGDGTRWAVKGLAAKLRAAGVFDSKHVPDLYLRASFLQRLRLLQGLMDTDGSVYDKGVCEFTNTNPRLIEGVEELLATFGIKFSTYQGVAKLDGVEIGPKWRIKFTVHDDLPVFLLPRKRERQTVATQRRALCRTRRVVSVEPVESVPTVCIQVDNPTSLFLVGRKMVPTHNSPILAAISIAELAGPVVFDGWDADGNPVGRPNGTPWVQIAAVSEDQTDNTYRAVYNMLSLGDTADDIGVDLGRSKVMRPEGNGILEPVTAAFGSREGQPITFACLDETHLWTPRNGGVKLAATLRRNAAKMGGRTFESTNAFRPGEASVAEATHKASDKGQKGLLYDANEGPWVEDLSDRDAFLESAKIAYGDSTWVSLDRIWSDATDKDTTESDARRFYLNQLVASENDYIPGPLWEQAFGEVGMPAPGTLIAAGFDGSRFHDSTALVGVEVASGRQFTIQVWSKPDGDDVWEVPRHEVNDAVARMYETWDVVFFYCDPPEWESEIATWHARFGKSVFQFPTRSRRRMSPALKAYRNAVKTGELTHDGDDEVSRHTLNARLVVHIPAGAEDDPDRHDWVVRKPTKSQKIDGLVTAVLAWSARTAAVESGAAEERVPQQFFAY